MIELTASILEEVIEKRERQSHKGTYGKVVLIGGSNQFGGAIILAASATVYSGAGLVSVVTAKTNHGSLRARLPEAMALGFDDYFIEVVRKADIIVIGPGLYLENQGLNILKNVLNLVNENQWLIIDGSAITLYAKNNLQAQYPHKTIFTPHEREWEELAKIPIEKQSIESSQLVVDQMKSIVVAKSHQTTIFTPNQSPAFITIGTPAQATGGMGDTLAGIIAGFLAQFKTKPPKSIQAAVYLHSLIANRLAISNYVVVPTKLIEQIPKTMKEFSRK